MKQLPYRLDPDSDDVDLYRFCVRHSISKEEAQRGNHAIRATGGAYERAVIVLRLLSGEKKWGDGYERKLDDCFEMNDGDAVAGWLIEFAEHDPRIHRLLTTHNNLAFSGSDCITRWTEMGSRNAHKKQSEFALT